MINMLWPTIAAVLVVSISGAARKRAIVWTGTVGILYRNGVIERQLDPGVHRYFDFRSSTSVKVVFMGRMAVQSHEASVISSDQFAFRLQVTPVVQIVDASAYSSALATGDAQGSSLAYTVGSALHFPELAFVVQAALLEAGAKRTLEQTIADPAELLAEVRPRVAVALPGAELVDLLLTAINLPPEVRKMFTEVERARREGLASLERARGEQASLRALANAARSLRSNPELAQLRMLQTMESARGAKTFVLGRTAGGDGAGDAAAAIPVA